MSLEQELIMSQQVNRSLLARKGTYLLGDPVKETTRSNNMTKESKQETAVKILNLMKLGVKYPAKKLCKYFKVVQTKAYLNILIDMKKVQLIEEHKNGCTFFFYKRLS